MAETLHLPGGTCCQRRAGPAATDATASRLANSLRSYTNRYVISLWSLNVNAMMNEATMLTRSMTIRPAAPSAPPRALPASALPQTNVFPATTNQATTNVARATNILVSGWCCGANSNPQQCWGPGL